MTSTNPETSPPRIRILTLNCWGLKYIAKKRVERLSEIGRRIAITEPRPEIVGLQECWTQEDYESIREQTRHILPYGKYYFSGIFGGGLAILSRWPIEESSMFAYPLNGRPTAFFRGDWFVGKGVACARIRTGPRNEDVAEVFCTHLHAPYESEPNDSYICHRTAQAWEIAKLMRGAAERGHLVIGLGDFNMLPLSFAHRLITAHAPVRDVWRHLYPDSSIGAAVNRVEQERGKPIPTAEFNLLQNGATCDSALNTWRWNKGQQQRLDKGENVVVDGSTSDPKAKRLDYIFVGDGRGGQNSPSTKWTIESAEVTMTERHPTLHCSLSDHFAVEATIVREPVTVHSTTETTPNPPLTPETYDRILDMITTYFARERFQRRARLGHFILSLIISIACFIAIWWSPRAFVSFILILLSTLSLSAGVIDGLIGGLFVGSEIRALKEFQWEVENAKRIAVATASVSGSRGSVEGVKEIEMGRVS
ncbi:phospholipase C type enzyme [Arachnomyces sp. PD_36]|nr:phospholipase C type enzyme [Arachnomyces sp. PD_36]